MKYLQKNIFTMMDINEKYQQINAKNDKGMS